MTNRQTHTSALGWLLALLLCLPLWVHAKDTKNLAVQESGAAKRIALVIGNDHYSTVPVLRNAVTDARSMAAALERAGFEVTFKADANLAAMKQAVRQFKARLSGGDEAVFFYSGHGVQLGAANYLLPVDITSDGEEQVKDDAIPLQRLLDDLQDQKVKFALAIIDACRDNPFKGSGRSIGGTRGLAPTSAANGQMVIFSAGAGQQALDKLGNTDRDKNGVFTRVFLQEMQKPGVEVHQVLRNVRSRVVAMAKSVNHDQMPALYDQVEGDFYFQPGSGTQVASLEHVPAQPAARVKTREQIEDEYWEEIKDSSDPASFEQYRKAYPKGRYLNTANLKIAQLKKKVQETERPQQQAAQTGGNEPEMIHIPGRNYEMGKYDVTRGEFAKFVSETGYDTENKCWTGEGSSKNWLEERSGRNWRNPGFAQDDNHPVVCVNWNDAQAYISWLSRKTGRQYRLPVEAEWEYACYGGSQSEYCGGNDINSVAWYKDNSGGQTHPVGQKQANGYGLYDMSGNVWQWMENNDDDKNDRALRGGSWGVIDPQLVRAAYRVSDAPAARYNYFGFRLARTLP